MIEFIKGFVIAFGTVAFYVSMFALSLAVLRLACHGIAKMIVDEIKKGKDGK